MENKEEISNKSNKEQHYGIAKNTYDILGEMINTLPKSSRECLEIIGTIQIILHNIREIKESYVRDERALDSTGRRKIIIAQRKFEKLSKKQLDDIGHAEYMRLLDIYLHWNLGRKTNWTSLDARKVPRSDIEKIRELWATEKLPTDDEIDESL